MELYAGSVFRGHTQWSSKWSPNPTTFSHAMADILLHSNALAHTDARAHIQRVTHTVSPPPPPNIHTQILCELNHKQHKTRFQVLEIMGVRRSPTGDKNAFDASMHKYTRNNPSPYSTASDAGARLT